MAVLMLEVIHCVTDGVQEIGYIVSVCTCDSSVIRNQGH